MSFTSELVLILSFCSVAFSETHLLFADSNGTRSDNGILATCASDDFNNAIAWITPTNSLFSPQQGKLKLDEVTFNLGTNHLVEESAYKGTFGPITDYLWESFEVYMTKELGKEKKKIFEKIGSSLKILNQFELNFSFLGKSDAQMYMCDGEKVENTKCIVIIIGGWMGFKSTLRNCTIKEAPTNSKDECQQLVDAVKHDSLILSENQWSQISVKYYSKKLQVIVNGKTILKYDEKSDGEFNNYKQLFAYSHNENALWKYHEYKYFEKRLPRNYTMANASIFSDSFQVNSNQLCLSIFANFEKSIHLVLYDSNNTTILSTVFQSTGSSEWQYLQMSSPVIKCDKYYLRISFDAEDYVAIRNIFTHSCDSTNFHFSTLEFKNDDTKNVTCTSLKKQEKTLSITEIDNTQVCKNDECNSCLIFYNASKCPHKMTCNEEGCFCSSGYKGSYCYQQCDSGWFGFNCASKCGQCKHGDKHCSISTGKCSNGCKDNYIPDTCHKRNLPVLLNITSIPTTCINSCEITIYDKKLNFDGAQIPLYYYILLKDKMITEESKLPSIDKKVVHFNNLLKSSNYDFEVILCVENNKTSCYKNDLVKFTLQTTCADIKENQIQMKSVDKRTHVQILDYNLTNQCDFNKYSTAILDERNLIIQNITLQQTFEIDNLNVYTNYTFQIYQEKPIYNITFTTDEDIPHAVKDLNINSTSSNKLIVVWRTPTPIRGKITHYFIEWKWIGKINCSMGTQYGEKQSKNVSTLEAELNELKPYSLYNISIYAFTKKGRGAESYKIGETQRDDSEFPSKIMYDTRVTENDVIIQINMSCSNWNGPFTIRAIANCTSNCCAGTSKTHTLEVIQPSSTSKINNLHPYTNYSINFYLNQDINPNVFEPKYVMTLPTVPNKVPFIEVYQLSKTSLSLRWSAPYPPTGKLKSFTVYYSYKSVWGVANSDSKDIREDQSKCKIWTNMYCTTLDSLYGNYLYSISISAHNEHVKNGGHVTELSAKTRIRKPDPPLNLKAIWDESKLLTIQWQHPNKTNGTFKGFNIFVNGKQMVQNIEEAQFIYTFNTTYQCTVNNHYVNVSLQTVNDLHISKSLYDTFYCPVFKPTFDSEPLLKHVINRTLTLFIPPISNSELISNMYILLFINQIGKNSDCKANGTNFNSYITLKETQGCFILRKYNQSQYSDLQNKEIYIEFKHLPQYNFEPNTFEASILLVNEYSGNQSHNWYQLSSNSSRTLYKLNELSTFGGFNYWWLLLVFVIVAIFATVGVIWHLHPPWVFKLLFSPAPGHLNDDSKPDRIPLTTSVENRSPRRLVPTTTQQVVLPSVRPLVAIKPNSQNLPVSMFGEYVKNAIQNGELQKQHDSFVRGMQKPAECGKLPMNYSKNRYKNLIAYDSSRVILKCVNGKPATDYINANYIQSPICKNAYIATQGPIDSTLYDFWFMIHTEGVQNIIMLANLVENGKQKVSAYWPDYKKMNKILTLEDIEVCATGTKTFYNYETRTFNLTRNNITTKVTQLHFTSWPDHGVPLYPESLMPFVKEILEIPHCSDHPILVHCSAGVGRTGTIILIDICLRQAQLTQQMNPFKEFGLLRSQRANLVDNIVQYKLVHLVLLHYFIQLQTTFNCQEFNVFYANLTDAILRDLLLYIDETLWQESAIMSESRIMLKIDPAKNRDKDIFPAQYGVLYLRPQANNDSTYINAVTVDGFNSPKRFIATQHPLNNTIDDFWNLIYEQDVTLVVSLQPTYDVKFWKNEGTFSTPFETLVEHFEAAECAQLNLQTIYLTLKGKQKREVKIIEMNGWDVDQDVPSNLTHLLAVWREVNCLKLVDSRIVVMCRNGATATGLYIAMNNLLDRIQAEQVVDVCKCVRIIRRSRKQFVNTAKQLQVLHRLAALLLSEFEIYSNFTPVVKPTSK